VNDGKPPDSPFLAPNRNMLTLPFRNVKQNRNSKTIVAVSDC